MSVWGHKRLGRHEPHIRPGDRFADRLGIHSVVPVPLHKGLYISRRHQSDGVAKRLKFARPMMRRGASFDTNQARRQLLEECQHVATLELTTENRIASASMP
jgi:hypothetical protein